MRADEVLDKAAAVIDIDGWLQVGGFHETGARHPRCVIGAIHEVQQLLPDECDRSGALDAFSSAVGALPVISAYRWNDEPGRTKGEVVAMLRAVAATLRAAESTVVPSDCVDAAQMEQVLPCGFITVEQT